MGEGEGRMKRFTFLIAALLLSTPAWAFLEVCPVTPLMVHHRVDSGGFMVSYSLGTYTGRVQFVENDYAAITRAAADQLIYQDNAIADSKLVTVFAKGVRERLAYYEELAVHLDHYLVTRTDLTARDRFQIKQQFGPMILFAARSAAQYLEHNEIKTAAMKWADVLENADALGVTANYIGAHGSRLTSKDLFPSSWQLSLRTCKGMQSLELIGADVILDAP